MNWQVSAQLSARSGGSTVIVPNLSWAMKLIEHGATLGYSMFISMAPDVPRTHSSRAAAQAYMDVQMMGLGPSRS